MSRFKAYLKLKIPTSQNIMGLAEDRYEISKCEYLFHQNINKVGEICSDVQGGLINISIINTPSNVLMGWVFDHTKYFNGEVVMLNDDETLEQVYFEHARCFDFNINYKADEDALMVTHLKIVSNQMRVGNIHFEFSKR